MVKHGVRVRFTVMGKGGIPRTDQSRRREALNGRLVVL